MSPAHDHVVHEGDSDAACRFWWHDSNHPAHGTEIWRPLEDAEESEFGEYPSRSQPTGITIGRGYPLRVFTCPGSFDHPHDVSMQ